MGISCAKEPIAIQKQMCNAAKALPFSCACKRIGGHPAEAE